MDTATELIYFAKQKLIADFHIILHFTRLTNSFFRIFKKIFSHGG